jgi:hypothetical protein
VDVLGLAPPVAQGLDHKVDGHLLAHIAEVNRPRRADPGGADNGGVGALGGEHLALDLLRHLLRPMLLRGH